MRWRKRAVGLIAIAIGLSACTGDLEVRSPVSPAAPLETIDLPAPRTSGDVSLEETLAGRRSVREFTDERLTLEEISQLLWAAQGITAEWGGRTAPSAGALYPLEVYVVTPEGLYHYLPEGHRAELLSHVDLRKPLAAAAFGQSAVSDAPTVLVVTGVSARTEAKYGDRAARYVHMEAGHAAENVLLQAVAIGLAGVPMGAFSDAAVRLTLALPADHAPLYLIPVGHSAEQ